MVKNLPAMEGIQVGKISWRRVQQPTLVSLPGESHEQRSLGGCIPWGCKELNPTEHAHARRHTHTHTHTHTHRHSKYSLKKNQSRCSPSWHFHHWVLRGRLPCECSWYIKQLEVGSLVCMQTEKVVYNSEYKCRVPSNISLNCSPAGQK